MKHWIHLPLAALVAGLVGYAGALLGAPERAARGADAGPSLAELALTVDELRAENARLAERLTALPAPAPDGGARRVPHQDLDAAIAAYLAKELGAATSDGDLEAPPADRESAAIAERILSGAVRGHELDALWQELRDSDRIDAVVAEIERQAALAPSNPDLQCELGRAYVQKTFDVGVGPLASAWGEKADQAFDRALALDEGHWEARFEKALALSSQPTFLGKQGEAMRQFELAMEQQERAAPRADHALTYYFLGNLYAQSGETEKALATWRRGAQRFPESEELRQKTESAR